METKERDDLSTLVFMILELAAEKFKDPSTGAPPPFMLSFLMDKTGVNKGYYLPILNHWGFTEYNSILWGGNLVLPWPHKDTWQWMADLNINLDDDPPIFLFGYGGWKTFVDGIRAGQIFFGREKESCWYTARTTSGGTRQGADIVKSKMNRLWANYQLKHDPETCRFCGPMEGEKLEEKGNFRIFANALTPFKWHYLIVPNRAWMTTRGLTNFYRLYSPEFISETLAIAEELAKNSPQPEEHCEMGIHVGALAGQNMPHPHFAILQR